MNCAPMVMSTNKEIVIVRATDALRDYLRSLGLDMQAENTKAPPAFFLVDSPHAGVRIDEPHYPHQKRAELMNGWFQRAFELELTEHGVPPKSWPETTDIEVFKCFFSVEYQPLIGDLGVLPLKTSMVPL